MARRADHTRQELKKMVLDAAWKLAGKGGFAALTARSLAAEIGYAPGTIYNIFRSMDDLYLEVNGRTLDELHKVLSNDACNDPSKSPAENMKQMASLYAEFARDYNSYWLMLFNYRLPESRQSLSWYQEKINLLFVPLENLLRPLFAPKQDRQRKMAGRILWASVHGLCFLQESGKIALVGGETVAGEMSSYLVDTFMKGLKQAAS